MVSTGFTKAAIISSPVVSISVGGAANRDDRGVDDCDGSKPTGFAYPLVVKRS